MSSGDLRTSSIPQRAVLRFAAELAKDLPFISPPDSLRQRLPQDFLPKPSLNNQDLPAFSNPVQPAPATPNKSPRKSALDDGVIPDAALKGRRLLDQYLLGEISRDDALAGFETATLRVKDVGLKTKSELDRLFLERLDQIQTAELPQKQKTAAGSPLVPLQTDKVSRPKAQPASPDIFGHQTLAAAQGTDAGPQTHRPFKSQERIDGSLPETPDPRKEIGSIETGNAGGFPDLFPEIEKKGLTTSQYRVGKKAAELSRTVQKYVNRDLGNGKSVADAAEFLGLINEALQSMATRSVFGEKTDQARQEIIEALSLYVKEFGDSVKGYIADSAVANGLTQDDANDIGWLLGGVFLALATAIAHGKRSSRKSRRKNGQTDDPTSVPDVDIATANNLPLTVTPGVPVVKVKTERLRSSNAPKGTPEWDLLNNPKPNTIYELDNGEIFRTNEFGYTEELVFKPKVDRRGRDARQTKVGKEGLDNDQGGHLRACALGGSCDRHNLVAQDGRLNNGEYREWERYIHKEIGNVPAVKITVVRRRANVARPDGFRVEWIINGEKFEKLFENKRGDF